jgi:hypothetical protein
MLNLIGLDYLHCLVANLLFILSFFRVVHGPVDLLQL